MPAVRAVAESWGQLGVGVVEELPVAVEVDAAALMHAQSLTAGAESAAQRLMTF